MVKLCLQGELQELRAGLEQIKSVLAFEESSDGILLEIEQGDRLFTAFDGQKGKERTTNEREQNAKHDAKKRSEHSLPKVSGQGKSPELLDDRERRGEQERLAKGRR